MLDIKGDDESTNIILAAIIYAIPIKKEKQNKMNATSL